MPVTMSSLICPTPSVLTTGTTTGAVLRGEKREPINRQNASTNALLDSRRVLDAGIVETGCKDFSINVGHAISVFAFLAAGIEEDQHFEARVRKSAGINVSRWLTPPRYFDIPRIQHISH